jgi:protein required for attachment to host cells
MKPDWILIANASRARLFQQQEPGTPYVLLRSFEHPASRLHSSELGDDERGRQRTDRAYGAAAYEPRMDEQRKEHLRFAGELADHLEDGAQHGLYGTVRVFAASPFLGELKARFGAATQRVLAGTYDVDLSAVGPAEIGRRVEREVAQAGEGGPPPAGRGRL